MSAITGAPEMHGGRTPPTIALPKMNRPKGLMVVAVLYFVVGAFIAGSALMYVYLGSEIGALRGVGVVFGALASVPILVGIGLLRGSRWAWMAALLVASAGTALFVLPALQG